MSQNHISFTSFNLYNLNEPGLRIYRDSDGWNQAEYDLKIEWTARVLREMQADVIGFQELWHKQSLTNALVAAGLDQEYTAVAPDDHAGQKIICAAAVRTSILHEAPVWIDDFPDAFRLQSGRSDAQTSAISVEVDSFSRPVLHLKVKPRDNSPVINVFVCHFKSKGSTPIGNEGWYRDNVDKYRPHSGAIGSAISTVRRTAEATALRIIISDLMEGADTPVVVLGDCNDGRLSNTLNILTGQPSFLHPLSAGGADKGLYTAQTLQQYRSQRDVYYTHIYKDTRESLDHILVSEEFYDHSRDRIWAFDGLDIANDHLNAEDHKITGTGDHGIIRAHFKYKPA